MRHLLTGFGTGLAIALIAASAAAQSCDVAAGEQVFKRCKACHKTEQGKSGVGPHLFGVVGRPVAGVADYNYSEAMQNYGAGGAAWDHARLDRYLAAPKDEVTGTKMAFAGLPKPDQRAEIICYLETIR